MNKQKEYYNSVKELRKWEKRRDIEGTNYVTEQYIQKYQTIVDELSGIPPNPKIKIEPQEPLTKREWNDMITRKVKSLERKIKKGTATWVDVFLYDVWTKDNKEEWRLPL